MDVSRVKLKWNNHQCVFSHYLQDYCDKPRFSDAMIACENRFFMVHRIILSTCSYYFEEIFQHAPNDNTRPVIILNDTPNQCVEWLLSYMYCGEVTVPKESLPVLFKLAEQLKVKGLSQLHVPETNDAIKDSSTGTSEAQSDADSSKKRPKSQKRKLSGSSNPKAKKIVPSLSTTPLPEGSGFVLALPQNAPSINIANPVTSPLMSSITNTITSPLLHATVMLPEAVPSTGVPVTVPFSAVPMDVLTQINANRSPISILASHLLGRSQDKSNPVSLTGGKPNGYANVDSASFNFTPAGTISENPYMIDIKEEVKDEPLTLGPDDPLALEDEDDDEDDNDWSGSDNAMDLGDTARRDASPEATQPPVLPASIVTDSVSPQMIGNGMLERVVLSEPEREPTIGGPSRTSHVLPQILVKPKYGSNMVVKAKGNKQPQPQNPINAEQHQVAQQQLRQLLQSPPAVVHAEPRIKVQMSTTNAKDDRLLLVSPPKHTTIVGKMDLSSGSKAISRIVMDKESTVADEVAMLNSMMDVSQPGPSPVSVTVVPQVRSVSEGHSHLEDDAGLREMMEFIQEGETDCNPTFVPIVSSKKRNQPYLIRAAKIATKNDEPVKFSLQGAKANQTISICMQYTDQKFKHIPVMACRLHQKSQERCNFQVSSTGMTFGTYKDDEGHPTAHMVVNEQAIDEMSNYIFYVTFICLNSCHKENGKKMELICKLLDTETHQILKEKRFEVRVCKNVKRDYKEVIQAEQFQAGQNQCLKVLVRPDSFLYPEEVALSENSNIVKGHTLNLESVKGQIFNKEGDPLAVESNAALNERLQGAVAENPNHEFYLVRLPNSKRGKMVLDLVRDFEKTIMDLEPASLSESKEDKDSQ